MKKRYTSDPKQASRRNAFANNLNNKRIFLTLLAFLLLGGEMAWAANWPSSSTVLVSDHTYTLTSYGSSGNQFMVSDNGSTPTGPYDNIASITITINSNESVTIVFNNERSIILNGDIQVTQGNLIMKLSDDNSYTYDDSNPTLKMTNSRNHIIKVGEGAISVNPTYCQFTLQGNAPSGNESLIPARTAYDFSNNFFVDLGGPKVTIDTTSDGRYWDPSLTTTTAGIAHTGAFVRARQGTVNLTNVTVKRHWCRFGSTVGLLQVFTNTANNAVVANITHCWFAECATYNGAALLKMQSASSNPTNAAPRTVTMTNCVVENNYDLNNIPNTSVANNMTFYVHNSSNGAIRSVGNSRFSMSIAGCNLNNNYGGAVRWHTGSITTPLAISNCIVSNNFSLGDGAGLLLKAPGTISNCTIKNNRSAKSGGGVYLTTYTEHSSAGIYFNDWKAHNIILTLDNTTSIKNNTALHNGGGLVIKADKMTSRDGQVFYYDGETSDPFKMGITLNGATIKGNHALGKNADGTDNGSKGYGGGIYISRAGDACFYGTECNLDFGTIEGNTSRQHGGGVCIDQDGASSGYSVEHPIQPISITTGDNNTNDFYIKGNTSTEGNGGGIYVYTPANVNAKVNLKKNTYVTSNKATAGSGGGLYLEQGEIHMDKATIGGNNASLGNIANQYGGGIFVNSGSVTMLNTTVQYNVAETQSGGGIFVESGDVLINPNENETTSPTKIDHNTANLNGGGMSNRNGKVVIFGSFSGNTTYPVEITYNTATTGSGGGIFCIGDASSPDYDIRMRRVLIQNNKAESGTGTIAIGGNTVDKGCGGGIYLQEGKISIINGKIKDNTANVGGGGVYTHSGDIDINPTGEERQPSQITGNTANINGGGLNTHSGKITVLGNDKDHRIIIKNNKATTGSGGAIFCMGENANAEYITVRHTDLVSNKTELGTATYGTGSEVAAGCGGGIYLQQGKITITDVNIQNNYAKVNGGGINNHSGSIDVNGCYIGSSHSTSGDHYYKADAADGDTDRGNKADNSGGGIYTRLGDIDIEDYVETSGNIFREESKVTFNEAAKNGGGIDTHEGIIYINKEEEDDQIEVAFNKAERGGGLYANAGTIKAYNALIHDNTATLHGGGANNHSGDIIIYGGILSNNTAKEGHGGGAYTNVGDIDLFQFPSTELQNPTLNHGTKVYNNIAKLNGGAFNNHTGRVDVRHATIYNNTSTLGNGGAIYCEGPHANVDRGLGYTIRLLCSDMVQNKTRGQDGTNAAPTGRGGGIYLKYGSIYAHYSNILNNEAAIAGGGLNNHEGNILLYGCDITGNRALELDGGGIFIKSGSITTGPSTERVASPTHAKATTVQKNTAYRNGGGIINLDGDITLNGDLIGGTTTDDGNIAHNGDGGGVYIANGTINMKGGKIAYNTANSGKGGGVYSGGGQFNIEKRDDNPEPITLIVDVEVKRDGGGQTATIHYHLIDQGKYGDGVSNVKHGIYWGTASADTRVVYGETSGYTYTQGEVNCQRITIPAASLSAGTTYKAKAFYEYQYSSTTIRGFSEELEFTTYSNTMPTVASGTVSNITKNSAQGSGKIMDNGGSDITARGVAFKKDGDTEFTLSPSTETTEFFTVDLTGLVPNTKYYAKAYATNSSGTSYGNQVEFTTLKNTPDMGNGVVSVTTSIENGVIVARASFTMPDGTTFGSGSTDVKAYGFVWSRDDDPELVSDHTIAGTLTTGTTFTATYPGVTPGIAFYVRAYASTIENEVNSSSDITNYSVTAATQCFSPMLDGSPVVRAINISNITQTSATITCQIYSGYEAGTTQYGVHLENDGTYHSSNNYNSSTGTYTVELTGLTPGTTYYLKAYATNDGGTHYNYGNGYNFTALPVMQPNVVITSVSNIQKTSATINCSVEDGGGSITAYGVKWGTSASALDQSIEYNNTQTGYTAPNGSFTQDLTGLIAHTTYYVQAYATNSAGTHTCQKVSFTTDYDKPTVTDLTISNTAAPDGTSNNATANFKVAAHSSDEADEVKTYGVCWSILHNPTRSKSVVSDTDFAETASSILSPTPVDCVQNMTQRFPNTKYYVRAYASTKVPVGGNLTDTVYSSETSFITLPAMVTGTASNVGKTSATLSGQIANRDSQGYLVNGYYGVCWGTSANPERQTSPANYTEQQITSANASAFNYSLATATLTSNTEYHFRAYFRHASGNIAYGADQTFHTKQYGVTASANPAAGGTTSVYYNANGTTCTVNATANTGYTFTNWTESGSVVSTSAEYEVTIGSTDHDLEANFTLNNYTVTVVADPAAGGSVSGGGSVSYGSSVTLTATANANYEFVNWTLNGEEVSSDTTYTFNYNFLTDTTFVAHFTTTGGRSRSQTRRPRDIYPAPAREPWDWDDDSFASFAVADTLPSAIDSLIQLCEQLNRDVVEPADIPMIDHNTAEKGGGIYVDYAKNVGNTVPTKLVFSGGGKDDPVKGQINFNYASEAGGGIYIADSGYMQMKYHCEVNANRVPAGKRGAGIYLDGRLYIGNASGDAAGTHGLIVNKNYAINVSDADFATNYAAIVDGTASTDTTNKYKKALNNVFLTRYESDFVNNWEDSKTGSADYDDLATVITLLSDISGKDDVTSEPYSNIGFSVLRGFCPVIATSASLWGPYVNTNTDPSLNSTYEGWLFNLMKSSKDGISGFDENGALFEDSETYVAIHTRTKSQPFLPKYIYLWGCWTYPAVKEDPESNRPMVGSNSQSDPASDSQWLRHYVITDPENDGILHWDIYSEEGLSWFSSYVNGLNVFKTGDANHAVYNAAKNPYATATLMTDVDLSSHIWIPIGSVTSFQDTNLGGSSSLFNDDPSEPHHFKGSFDGQGHTIKGMNVRYVSGIYKYGLFGYLDEGATVKNVFIDDSEFITDSDSESYSVGGIAGLVTADKENKNISISGSEARVQINVTNAVKSTSYVGGLVGQVADGTASNNTTIHSSMAMPEITGTVDYMGGLVGQLGANNKLYNSFSNPKFPQTTTPWYAMSSGKYIGGLVGDNKGTVENCYSRLQGDEPTSDGTASVFGWFAGTNNTGATIDFCYAPVGKETYVKGTQSGTLQHQENYSTTLRYSNKYGFKHRDQQLTTTHNNTYATADNNNTLSGGLMTSLNAWVAAKGATTYHPWMRSMATAINDDYPIPNFKVWTGSKDVTESPLYNAVGAKDGVFMEYKLDVNDLLKEYVALDKTTYPNPVAYLYNTNLTNITQTNIGTTHDNVTLAINEDVGILQDVNLKARVGVTFDNSKHDASLWGEPYDWHMFSSALNEVAMGLQYHGDNPTGYHVWDNYTSGSNYLANGIPNNIYNGSTTTYDRDKMDPPRTYFRQTDDDTKPGYTTNVEDLGYFPANTPYGRWRDKTNDEVATLDGFPSGSFDFYCYGEAYYQHWINFKRRGDATFLDHWREDANMDHPTDYPHYNIPYINENKMVNGKGYLMAVSEASMLMADGTLNNGDLTYKASYTENPEATYYDVMVRGTNLIGNPYQSYLDFDEFAKDGGENSGLILNKAYYMIDADRSGYITYPDQSSSNPEYAPQFIHPHQGFFVKVSSTQTLKFTNDMRVAGNWNNGGSLAHSNFRDGKLNYPLVNLICNDSNGKRDLTTVETNRPEVGGAQKMHRLRNGNAILYARFENSDYQALFAPVGTNTVPVRFEVFEDDVFTMTWSTYNGDFHYLHLIDNITGIDVDCLTASEYKFEGRTTDYLSRFKLVFDVTGVDEHETLDPAEGPATFAFQFGDELVVNGDGMLQLFDLNGRCLLTTQAVGAQSSISLPKVANGLYLLRLTDSKQVRTQKIVIR